MPRPTSLRAALWWVLWRDNKADASRLCDEIARTSPPPAKLLEAIRDAPLRYVPPTRAQRWADDPAERRNL